MELLLGEHGETLYYGIIGIIVITVICSVCPLSWSKIMPYYEKVPNEYISQFIDDNTEEYPTIEVDGVK